LPSLCALFEAGLLVAGFARKRIEGEVPPRRASEGGSSVS
jgi:hypothetical protein